MANYSDPIRIWAWEDSIEALQKAIEIYNRDVDEDAQFEVVELMPPPNAYDQIMVALMAGEQMDIVFLDDEKFRSYLKNEKVLSRFVPLNLEVNPVDLNFIPYKIANLTYESEFYGVPYSVCPVVMYYNRELLADYDITIDDDITWDDFIRLAHELFEKSEENTYMLMPPIDADISKILWVSSGFDNNEEGLEEGIETLRLIEQFKSEKVLYPEPFSSYEEILDLMAEKRIAAVMGGPWWIEKLKTLHDEGKGDWRVTRIPKSDFFTKEVGLGGCSWIVIQEGEAERQVKSFDFLIKTFGESVELARMIAEKRTVPVLGNVADELGNIDPGWTPTCSEQNAIQFFARVSEDIPEFYYGDEKTQKISQNLENLSNGIIYWNLPLQDACDYFENFINNVIYNNGVDDTPPFPIPVVPKEPVLERIEITEQPTTKKYAKGESFDPSGMVVTAYYDNGFSQEISNNALKISPTSFKNSGNTSVTISYTEGKKTKTANVNVIVWKNLADKSKNNQTELKYGCEAGVASVNLFNQRLLFEHPDVSIGANTYQISVSHIYNSLFDERTTLGDAKNNLQTGMGKGFKLNVQQYVIPSGKNYLYIDEVGHRHTFEALEDGTSYYDTSGLGLILTVKTYEKVIGDDFGNKMVFDTSGRLVKTVSGFNAGMVKTFIYNAKGQLEEIYDNRNKSNAITLEYDQTTGLLKTMSCKQGGVVKRSISYVYKKVDTDFMLVDIIDERGDTSFAYDTEGLQMIYAASKLDKSALKFTYSNGALTEVSTGVIDNETSVVGTAQISSATLSMSAENVQSKNTFAFNKASATVTNEKNIQLLYSFNPDGVTTSILEANGGDINDLRTLEKQPGVRIMSGGSSSERINKQNVYRVISNEVLSTDNVITLSEVIPYRKTKCPDYKHYICSFWLKFSKATSENCEAKITVESKTDFVGDYTEEGRVTIDNTAADSWQLVAIPIQISGNTIKTIKIELSGMQGYKIGDMRLYYSPLVRFCVGKREGENIPLDKITQIKIRYLGDSAYTVRNINQNCYMTEKDLQATYLSRYNGQGYTLSLCDNTEKYRISDVKLCGQEKEFILTLDDKGRAQFYQETQSPDGDIRIYGELYFNKDADGEEFTGICQYTEAVKGGTTSCTSTYVDYKGKIRRERDEYETETEYEYDDDGLLCKKIVWHPKITEKLVYEMTTTAEKTTESSAVSQTETCYDFFGNVGQVKYKGNAEAALNMLTTTFHYDNSKGRLDSVENNLGGQNSLKYNENGRLSEVTPTGYTGKSSYGYEFEHNKFGEPVKYSLLYGSNKAKQILASKEINYINGTLKDKKYRQAENRADETVVSMDEYGRTKEISEKSYGEGEKISRFTRQELWESAGASEVSEMYDAYEGRTYEYSYDDRNNCTGYEIKNGDDIFLKIKKSGENQVSYSLKRKNENIQTRIDYDAKKLMNPRVTKTQLSNLDDMMVVHVNSEYTYDELGRIKQKNHWMVNDAGVFTGIAESRVYKQGTILKENVTTYVDDSQTDYSGCQCTHDCNNGRGLITQDVCKTISFVDYVETYEEIWKKDYTYDAANRLKTETYAGGWVSYDYNPDGSIAREVKGAISQEHFYEKGRLTALRQNNGSNLIEFGYDNIGNCTHYYRNSGLTANMEWERGSLLKKYTDAEAEYYYNSQGIRYKKKVAGKETVYYLDGGKIIAEETDGKRMRYIYDVEGIAGFEIEESGQVYHYIKDGQGNVVSIFGIHKEVARYEYDAWGNCTTTKSVYGIGELNPIRWKSQYYDVESGLYYIGGRYYSPLMKQYISAANPESALGNAGVIYGLNLYLLTLTNPVSLVYNGYTIEPNSALAYDPPNLSKWDLFWRSPFGKVLSFRLFVAATVLAVACPGFRELYIGAVTGTVITLCLGGAISGWSRKKNGGEFWEGFACYINENWSQTLAISMALSLVTFGISQAVSAVRAASANKQLANAAKTSQEASKISNLSYDDMLPAEKIAYDGYSKNGWQGNYSGQAKGTRAGGNYLNVDGKLPAGTYREFDINPPIPGIGRDASRFVVNNNKIVYLTRDHYSTFFKIIK